MVYSPMGSQVETVLGWLDAVKTETGKKKFLEYDLEHAIELAKCTRAEELNETDIKLFRLLRNCVPLGERAVTAILQGGVVPEIVRILNSKQPKGSNELDKIDFSWSSPGARPVPQSTVPVDTAFAAACAQLLANLASAGSDAATEVWTHCFPGTFQGLVMHSAGQVHNPAILAMYACCRQRIRCSRDLCAALWSSDAQKYPDVSAIVDCANTDTGAVGGSDAHGCQGGGGEGTAGGAGSASVVDGTGFPSCTTAATSTIATAATATTVAAGAVGAAGATNSGAITKAAGPAIEAAAEAQVIWEAVLGRLLAPESRHAKAEGPDFTALLCGCVALRQGMLGPLLALLALPQQRREAAGGGGGAVDEVKGGAAACAKPPASTVAGDAALGPPLFGPLWPVLLHVLAQELYELTGRAVVDLGEWTDEGGAEALCLQPSRQHGGGSIALPHLASKAADANINNPVQAQGHQELGSTSIMGRTTTDCMAGSIVGSGGYGASPCCVRAAAVQVEAEAPRGHLGAAPGRHNAAELVPSTCNGHTATLLAGLPAVARPVAAALLQVGQVVEAAARSLATRKWTSGELGEGQICGAVVAAAPAPVSLGGQSSAGDGAGSEVFLKVAVLEAGLEALKSATQREDGGRAIANDIDLVEWLLCDGGLLPIMLGMLAAMQPAATMRTNRRQRPADGVGGGDATGPPPSDRPVMELPHELKTLSMGFPAQAPFMGYRGDLVSVLANGAFRRPRVVSALLALGGLELLLAQTHLDEHSPLAREWALWGVRNMCESSQEVQARIAGLELQTAVETPELRQLGMRLELDKATGKLKVSKTEEARALLNVQPDT